MKMILALLSVVSFSLLSAAEEPNPPAVGLEGQWQIVERVCSSGAPPADQFRVGFDEATLNFKGGDYNGHIRLMSCHYWITGKYELNKNVLRISRITTGSSCPGRPSNRPFSNLIELTETHLTVFDGPFAGGVCPSGDLLETTYEKKPTL